MKHIVLLITLAIFNVLSAQNLVGNPSFEQANKTPFSYGEFHNNVKNWSSPSFGTPDYYSTRSQKMNQRNYRGIQDPKTGDCFAGVYLFATKNRTTYREYIQGELKETLKKGATYKVSFYISLANTSTHSVDSVNLLFFFKHNGEIKNTSTLFGRQHVRPKIKDGALEIDTLKPQEYSKVKFYLDTKKQLTYNWVKVETSYIANGLENYLVIGNLNKNERTNITQHNVITERAFSYYYIDEVSVIEDNTIPIEKNVEVETITFQPEKTYTFQNVLFDFDKAELLEVSIEELDKLYQHLQENKELHIEIYGHTDNVGLASRNQELSRQRAKAVSEYLIKKGLEKSRIKWFGFGAEAPLVKNDSEENKAKNRRVEFKLKAE